LAAATSGSGAGSAGKALSIAKALRFFSLYRKAFHIHDNTHTSIYISIPIIFLSYIYILISLSIFVCLPLAAQELFRFERATVKSQLLIKKKPQRPHRYVPTKKVCKLKATTNSGHTATIQSDSDKMKLYNKVYNMLPKALLSFYS
jgi:hypothetical protein